MLRMNFGWSWTGLLEKKKYDKAGMINTPKQEELNIFILFMSHPMNTNKECRIIILFYTMLDP